MTAKPTLRRLAVSIEHAPADVPATLDLMDYGDADHRGQLWIDGESFPARLSGVTFTAQKRAGRPRREARDVAVWLATEWFRREGAAKIDAQIVDLWGRQGFKGISEDGHVRSARKRALKVIGVAPNAAILFTSAAAAWVAEGVARAESLAFESVAWVWEFGTENATHGLLTVRAGRKVF